MFLCVIDLLLFVVPVRHLPARPSVVLVTVPGRPPGTVGSSLTMAVAQAVKVSGNRPSQARFGKET